MARAPSPLLLALPARLARTPDAEEQVQGFLERARTEAEALGAELSALVSANAAELVRHATRALPAELTLAAALDELHAGELLLTFACAKGDASALHALERLVRAHGLLARVRSERLAEEDLLQLLRERLLVSPAGEAPRISEYSGRGSLGSWLKVVLARVLLNELRRGGRELPVDDAELLAHLEQGEQQSPLPRYRHPRVQESFLAAWRSASTQDRNLMRQRFLDTLTLVQLGKLYRVDRATISRRLLDTRRRLLAATRAELAQRIGGATPSELDELLKSVEDQLVVSLRALELTPAPE